MSQEIFTPTSENGRAGIFGEATGDVSVESATGSLKAAIPFELPKARGAVQPTLSLRYISDLAIREAGTGWGLDIPCIERSPLSWPPEYTTEDRISFSGEALVHIGRVPDSLLVAGAPGEVMPRWAFDWHYYRAQVEGSFRRFFWSPDGRTWRVQFKSGETMEFGAPLVLPGLGAESCDEDLAANSSIFRWNLVRKFDTHDEPNFPNTIIYVWETIGRLKQLTDIFDTAPVTSPVSLSNYANHTRLLWETPVRPSYSYCPIWLAVPEGRLARVDITSKTYKAQGPREMVRRYHLTYMKDRDGGYVPGDQAPLFQRSFLYQVQIEGRCSAPIPESGKANPARDNEPSFALPDNTGCPTLPPITLYYTPGDLGPLYTGMPADISVNGHPIGGNPFGVPLTDVALTDIDDSGLVDIVRSMHQSPISASDTPGVFMNTLINGFTRSFDFQPVDFSAVATAMGSTNDNSFLSTVHGLSVFGYWGNQSGYSVLWRTDSGPGGAFYSTVYPQKTIGGRSWKLGTPIFGPNVDNVVDIDGDGLADGYAIEGPIGDKNAFVYLTQRDLTIGPEFVRPFQTKQPSNLVTSDLKNPLSGVTLSQFADMNGDGIADYVTIGGTPGGNDAHIVYYPGDGRGNFGCQPTDPMLENPSPVECPPGSPTSCSIPRIAMSPAPGSIPVNFSSGQIQIHDINGDGLADIIAITNGALQGGYRGIEIKIWINEDGKRYRKLTNKPGADLFVMDPDRPGQSLGVTRAGFADLDGDGIDEIVFVTANGVFYIDMYWSHVLKKVRPGLLSKIENGLGATTEITYRNVAELDIEAERFNVPWSTHSRVSSPVVTEIRTRTQLPSPYNVDRHVFYEYRDPAFDPWEGRLKGFHTTTVADLGRNLATTYRFAYGPCQVIRGGGCEKTSDDDDLKAIVGLPLQVDTYQAAVVGSPAWTMPSTAIVNFSTVHYTYESRVLMRGTDGRSVRFAFPRQIDTYLYDAGDFQKDDQTVTYTDYEYSTLEEEVAVKSQVTTWAQSGTEHLRIVQNLDSFGNITEQTNLGRIDDAGTPLDDPISTSLVYKVQGTTGWQWRAISSTLTSGSGSGVPRKAEYQYDPKTGNLVAATTELTGTVALDRFHEDPSKAIAPPPLGASVDGPVTLMHVVYDKFGNVILSEGPETETTTGLSRGVQTFTYDNPYQQLISSATRYNGALGVSGQTSSLEVDRGFGTIIGAVTPCGAATKIELDGFGRPVAVYRPSPVGALFPESVPSIKIEYRITTGGPIQQVHLHERTDSTTYRETWTYVDGTGQQILSLRQADPSAGDQGDWVGTGLFSRSNDLITEVFPSWFYSGDPANHPISAPPGRGERLATFAYDTLGRSTNRMNHDNTEFSKIIYHALSSDFYAPVQNALNGNHLPTTVAYDGHGRKRKVVRRIKSLSAVNEIDTEFTYLPTGELSQVKQSHSLHSDVVVRWGQYDSLGRLVVNAEPNTSTGFVSNPTSASGMKSWRYAYNDAGLLVGTSDPRGCGVNYFYDGLSRLVAQDFSPGQSSQMDYTPPDLTNGDGTELYICYDAPEPGEGSDLGANPWYFVGKVASVRDRGSHTRFTYDGRSRLVSLERRIAKPGVSEAQLQDRYATSWWHTYARFDDADRPIEISTGADVTELLDSGGASVLTTAYNRRGFVQSIGGSYGELIARTQFDANGLPLAFTYGDVAGTTANFQYDAALRLQRYTVSRVAPLLWSGAMGAYTPPPTGDLPTLQRVLEDQLFAYDANDYIVSVNDQRVGSEWAVGSKPVGRQMTYDDLNRLTQIGYQYPTAAGDAFVSPFQAEAASATPIPSFTYQQRMFEQAFRYDWLGNISQWSDDVGVGFDRSLGHVQYGTPSAGPNQIVEADAGFKAQHDAAGNLVNLTLQRSSDGVGPTGLATQRFVYDWDEIGRLSHARRWDFAEISASNLAESSLPVSTPSVDLQYSYSVDGRVLKTASVPDGSHVHTVEIFDSLRLNKTTFDTNSGDYVKSASTQTVDLGGLARVIHDPRLPSPPSGSSQHVLIQLSDWLGSTTTVIDKDTSELVEKITYQAFGATESDYRPSRWGNSREDFRFSGKEDDFSVCLTLFGARYYHAILGRWASADPLTIHGFVGLNPYTYVANSPHNGVDAVGLDEEGLPDVDDGSGDSPGFAGGVPTGSSSTRQPSAGSGRSGGGAATLGGSSSVLPIGGTAAGFFDAAVNAVTTRFSADNIHDKVNEAVDKVQDFLADQYHYWSSHPDEFLAGTEDKADQFYNEWQFLSMLSGGGPPIAGPAPVTAGVWAAAPVSLPALVPPVFAATRGSTAKESKGRTLPRNLGEQLAVETAMSDPASESAVHIEKAKMGDPTWHGTQGWQKMQRIVTGLGNEYTVHYVYNPLTKEADDFKLMMETITKFAQPYRIYPGDLK